MKVSDQQSLSGFVKESCPECKEGELVMQGEYSKFDGVKKLMVKLFRCNLCKFMVKRCS